MPPTVYASNENMYVGDIMADGAEPWETISDFRAAPLPLLFLNEN